MKSDRRAIQIGMATTAVVCGLFGWQEALHWKGGVNGFLMAALLLIAAWAAYRILIAVQLVFTCHQLRCHVLLRAIARIGVVATVVFLLAIAMMLYQAIRFDVPVAHDDEATGVPRGFYFFD